MGKKESYRHKLHKMPGLIRMGRLIGPNGEKAAIVMAPTRRTARTIEHNITEHLNDESELSIERVYTGDETQGPHYIFSKDGIWYKPLDLVFPQEDSDQSREMRKN